MISMKLRVVSILMHLRVVSILMHVCHALVAVRVVGQAVEPVLHGMVCTMAPDMACSRVVEQAVELYMRFRMK